MILGVFVCVCAHAWKCVSERECVCVCFSTIGLFVVMFRACVSGCVECCFLECGCMCGEVGMSVGQCVNDIGCWLGVCICVSAGVCMFKTRSGGSLWQCVYVGGCVC